ncbi:MAG: hypothetical protein V4613_10465 [Bacteroidota bacterium]
MILRHFTAIVKFYTLMLRYVLGLKGNKKAYFAGKTLIDRPQGSHRIGQRNHTDILIIPRYYYRLLVNIFSVTPRQTVPHQNNGIALYDAADNVQERLDYITAMSGESAGLYIHKLHLMNQPTSLLIKLVFSVQYFMLTLFVLPFTLSAKRAMYALMIHEVFEHATLLHICKQYNIKRLYYACIFEKDSNASALLLQKCGIYVIKNPSEDPLYYHNRVIIADELGICNDYQWEEIVHYKDTIFVDKFTQWLPEQCDKLLFKTPAVKETKKNSIGYYTGASWLNKVLKYNETTNAYDPYQAEEELEQHLSEYLKARPHLQLKIFLHPLEKNENYRALSLKHYASIFENLPYEYADFSKNTGELFDECDVAVTIFSGIMTYRFYRGLKGIYYNPYFPDFPIPSSSLYNVSAKTSNEMFDLLDECLAISSHAFVETKLKHQFVPTLAKFQ